MNILKFFTKIFSNKNNRILHRINNIVNIINNMEYKIQKLNDIQIRNKTQEFKNRISNGETLDNLLPEAFAIVREACKRVFKMRIFDVQLLGGIVLHNGCIAEMRTGEGKTLTSTLSSYLNALNGKGVHIVTVNNYLAKRDAENNKALFNFLDMSVGINLSGMSINNKKKAYLSDITYGTNNEYGFDYLKDNMVLNNKDKVQNNLNYALLDEIDSILIDEARTPLIISSESNDISYLYNKINLIIPKLIRQDKEDSDTYIGNGDFYIEEDLKQVNLTERGLIKIEKLLIKNNLINKNFSLYSTENIILMYHINAALKAHNLYFKNIDYIIYNNKIIIVDEHTGRIMPGRRWGDGIHQAIEAKENLNINYDNQILASVTFQNYFRLYDKISGMTGTASTESFEFKNIYNLDTITIPTNKPMIRKDYSDLFFLNEKDKIIEIINDIKKCVLKKQPVLVGTISIEKSELISFYLKKEKIYHKVLNAKLHDLEAYIISQAGKPGAVTIATNMAGRGTDIILGGNYNFNNNNYIDKSMKYIWKKLHKQVILSGGLHIIGTERHESRRIDNQLRGRSGRQGDPGSSRFYLSMDDQLMRIFISDNIYNIIKNISKDTLKSIEHPLINKAIKNAQKKIENNNFEIRKQLLKYDDIINEQRIIIYKYRNFLLNLYDFTNIVKCIKKDVFYSIINIFLIKKIKNKNKNILNFKKYFFNKFKLNLSISYILKYKSNNYINKICKYIMYISNKKYIKKEYIIGKKRINNIIKNIFLKSIDLIWQEYLFSMDYLKKGINLRSYIQRDPYQEYKKESFFMFNIMLKNLKYEIIEKLELYTYY